MSTSEHGTSLLSAIGLQCSHQARPLWSHLDLNLKPGDRLGLVAPSGAGKTLLLRALAQLNPLQTGELRCQGRRAEEISMPRWRSTVMLVPQSCAVMPGSVEHNLRSPLQWQEHRQRHPWDRNRVLDWLEQLGRPAEFLDWDAEQLSGGELQVLNLIRALQLEPAILLLDECSASLDHATTLALEALLEQWLQAGSRACVLTSHDSGQIQRFCNRVLELP
jgi:putative ABC transport system ATP-binding protein